jgi:LytS/YehU family sensor histidine kinase
VVHSKSEGDLTQLIPPLIAFSLVENAFKHGMSESKGTCVINIDISVEGENFNLIIKNPMMQKSDLVEHPDSSKGLGLHNVSRQLSLIYQENYLLSNDVINDQYLCTLKLPLNRQ